MPRNRNQPAVIVPLTLEQETTLGWFGNLLTGVRGESNLETATRVFGSAGAARRGWHDHRDVLMTADPVAGRRVVGWWLFELQREPPPVETQAAILRELGELTEAEEQTLASWRAMTPEIPADLGIDHVTAITIDPTPEDTHDTDGAIDAAPVPTRSPAEVSRTEAAVPAPEDEREVAVTPRILDLPSSTERRRPPELTGWESHDAN